MKCTFILFIATIFLSCTHKSKPETTYMNTGYIEGRDLSNMICSGGYVIVSDSHYFRTFYDTLPPGSGINLKTAAFPIKVRFNWHYQVPPNPCNYIVIDAIEKAD